MKVRTIITSLAAVGLALTACGDDNDEAGADTAPAASADVTPPTDSPANPSSTTASEGTEPDVDGDDAPTTSAARPSAATATTIAVEDGPVAGTADGEGQAAELGPQEIEVADLFVTVFDSTVPVADKRDYIEDADELGPTLEAYAAAGEAVGGIGVEVSDVVIDGDAAEVTYGLTFAGNPMYDDLHADVTQIDGEWVVSRDQFCSFMGQARVSCP